MRTPPPSTGDVLCAVRPALGDALVSPKAFDLLMDSCGRLPATDGGLECHLGSPHRVDLALRLQKGSVFHRIAMSDPVSSAWPSGGPLDQGINDWLLQEQEAELPLSLWLEYDLHGKHLPDPSLFLGPGQGKYDVAPKLAQWSHTLNRLTGGDYERSVSSAVQRFEHALPPGAWVVYVGRMAPSRGDLWRIVVSGMAPDDLAAYLRDVFWPGAAGVLEAALTAAQVADGSLSLGLDILPDRREQIGPVLGLEFAMSSDPALAKEQVRRLAPGVDAEVAEALARWPGVTCCGDSHWPEPLRKAVGGVVRRLNHLKLVYRGSARPQCKAYLYFGLIGAQEL